MAGMGSIISIDFKGNIVNFNKKVADIKNTGGRPAGSVTAAHFIGEFVGDTPWVHLDIAGTAMSSSSKGWIPQGATGFPCRTLIETVLRLQN